MDIRYEQHHNSENLLPFTLYAHIVRTMDRRSEKSNFHEEYELEYCHEGEGFVLVDGQHIPFCEGDIILIHPGEVHYTYSENSLTYSALLFSKDIFMHLGMFQEQTPCFSHRIVSEDVARAFREICHLCEGEPTYKRARAISALIDLCLAIAPHIQKHTEPPMGKNKTVSEALEYIRKHHAEPLTLNGTGESIVTHIHRVRVGVACELLARGESVSDTAHAVGFENLSFFTKIFKRYQGVTPSDFQKKNVAGV